MKPKHFKEYDAEDIRYAFIGNSEFQILLEDAESVSQQGDNYDNVRDLLEEEYISYQLDLIGEHDIREAVSETGAWDTDELDDDEKNRERYLWILGNNITEEETDRQRAEDD